MSATDPSSDNGFRPDFIKVEDFSFHYGEKQALFDITMDIPEHQVTALIGPSGCGKSTLLRNMNRMNDLIDGVRHEGDIRLNGTSLYDPSVEVISLRKRVGMVFQKYNPFAKSIYENVVFSLRVAGRSKKSELDETVERSLTAAALWDEVKDRVHESAFGLSGGQQQRLCIARAIANRPEILLMDEPKEGAGSLPISTLKYDAEKDIFLSPNGTLERLEDVKADKRSILGEWSGSEWKFEEETSLGKTKENFAIGKTGDGKFGLIVYRIQEVSSLGSSLYDKSLVIRFPMGEAGILKPQAPPQK